MKGLTEREHEILQMIEINPTISREMIANELGISKSAVGTHLHNLTQKGYLLGRGYVIAPRKEIAVVGGSNIDLKGYSKNYLTKTSNPGKIVESLGGVGRNIAENLGNLGDEVVFLTAVGDDHFGEILLSETAKSGVNIDYVKKINNKRTGIYLAHLDSSGELIGAISDMDILNEIDQKYIENHYQIIRQSSIVVLDTNLTKKTIKYILDIVQKNNLLVVVEPVSIEKAKKLKPHLKQVDFITPNIAEAEVLLGREVWNNKDLPSRRKRIEQTYNDMDISLAMIITCGSKGAILLTEESSCLVSSAEISKAEINETTGAGDALTAGLVSSLVSGKNLLNSVKFGIKAAVATIKSEDTANPDLARELEG